MISLTGKLYVLSIKEEKDITISELVAQKQQSPGAFGVFEFEQFADEICGLEYATLIKKSPITLLNFGWLDAAEQGTFRSQPHAFGSSGRFWVPQKTPRQALQSLYGRIDLHIVLLKPRLQEAAVTREKSVSKAIASPRLTRTVIYENKTSS